MRSTRQRTANKWLKTFFIDLKSKIMIKSNHYKICPFKINPSLIKWKTFRMKMFESHLPIWLFAKLCCYPRLLHSFPFDNNTKHFRLCLSYEVRETLEFERPDIETWERPESSQTWESWIECSRQNCAGQTHRHCDSLGSWRSQKWSPLLNF